MVNRIRNRVMHPCKGTPPSEDEFLAFKGFVAFLRIDDWKVPDANYTSTDANSDSI